MRSAVGKVRKNRMVLRAGLETLKAHCLIRKVWKAPWSHCPYRTNTCRSGTQEMLWVTGTKQ